MKTTEYEKTYLKEINRLILGVGCLHIPVALLFDWHFKQDSFFLTLGLCLFILLGPIVVFLVDQASVLTSIVLSISLMGFSALLIHLSRGMIEIHFHIFTFIGVMIIFANPWPILLGALTVAIHHVSFFFLLPSSLFNYQATFGIVIVHAVFVIIETIPATFIAIKFGRFVRAQGTMMTELDDIAKEVLESSQVTREQNRGLNQQMVEESSRLQKTADGFDKVQSMTQKNAQSAAQSKIAATEANESALAGRTSIREMLSFVNDIGKENLNILKQVTESSEKILEIVKIVTDIGSKTKVINDIVFQTKLLSFNASVEAARAGEQGKGFAVVAEEVGNLAQMSGKAAQEISEMLDQSITKVQNIEQEIRKNVENTIQSGNRKIESGIKVTQQCDQALEQIVTNVARVNEMITEITEASTEQATSITVLTQELATLEENNQNNLNTFVKSSQAVETVSNDATRLHELVNVLIKSVS